MAFQYAEYGRETGISQQVMSVTGTDGTKLTSNYNGMLGLAPYRDNAKEKSYLWQLKSKGVIDHLVVSFYVNLNEGNSSQIKFGSFDRIALSQGYHLTMYKTLDTQSWALRSD